MSRLTQYEMKDSGVEWIGLMPKGWKSERLKFVLRNPLQYGANSAGVDYSENLPRYVRITDITNDNKLSAANKLSLPIEEAGEYLLEDKDILLARSGATAGKAFFWRAQYGKAAFAGYLIRAKIDAKKVLPEYAFYSMLGKGYEQWKSYVAVQATIPNIGANKYNEYALPVPPLTEQAAIAAYLDEKCGAIDEIIAEAKASIGEYKAWKSSVVFEAVTKGLDPNAEMKDSGVEWIGQIPKGWSCVPMKFVLNERNQKNDPVVTSERLSLSIDIGVTLYAEKTTNLDRFKEDVSQYKVAHAGDLVLNSMNMIVGAVGIAPLMGCVSPAYYVFHDSDASHTVAKFCNYIFKNKRLRGCLFSLGQGIMAIDRGDGKVNTCRLKVSRDDLGRIMLPCPPIDEQQKIISFLDEKCGAIDEIIAEKEALISALENYKKSLIFETVTGKRRVCG